MSTTTAASTAETDITDQHVTQLRVFASELTKLRSLRSTVYSLLAAVVFIIGLAIVVSAVQAAHWPPTDPAELASFDPTEASLSGIFLAQLAIGVLGVLLMTGEYATGMVRATFAAVPTRLPVLWAKTGVFAATTLVLTIPAVLIAFFVGQAILSSQHIQASFSDPGVARAVVGAALYLTVVGILGLGLGALVRSTAGGIAALFSLLFVLPIIVHFLPTSFSTAVDKYLPSSAGRALLTVRQDPTALSPWAGFAVFCAYAAVALAAAAIALRSRDA